MGGILEKWRDKEIDKQEQWGKFIGPEGGP